MNPDGTSSVPGSIGVTRVSDHYSACFVTRAGEVACWGVAGGGTWNGVAKRDPSVGLTGVVDIAINQTHACAALSDGSVSCWASDGVPKKQALPGRAREVSYSIAGRACALLDDGTVASTKDWTSGSWGLVQGLTDVAHLLACDRAVVCGEVSKGTALCTASLDPSDPRKGIPAAQEAAVQAIVHVAPGSHLAMNDYATAFCAYSDQDVRCFDAASHIDQTVPGLRGVQEIALGATKLAGTRLDSAACARLDGGAVRCWSLAAAKPFPMDPTESFGQPCARIPPGIVLPAPTSSPPVPPPAPR